MMKTASLDNSIKYALWTECANTAILLNNIVKLKSGISFRAFHGKDPKCIENLHILEQEAHLGKIEDQGIKVNGTF
jgi:hypothetical protein